MQTQEKRDKNRKDWRGCVRILWVLRGIGNGGKRKGCGMLEEEGGRERDGETGL